MYGEYLGYDDLKKITFICNEEMHIKHEYPIGEMFVNFIELDLSSFSSFYNDMAGLYINSYTSKNENESIEKISLNIENELLFFQNLIS